MSAEKFKGLLIRVDPPHSDYGLNNKASSKDKKNE